MAAALNLFPARVPIGKAGGVDVYMTREFMNALEILFERVGGATSMSIADLAVLGALESDATAAAPDVGLDQSVDAAQIALMQSVQESAAREAALTEAPATLAEIEKRLAAFEVKLEMATSQMAAIAEQQKALDALGNGAAVAAELHAEVARAQAAIDELRAADWFADQPVDWSRPGTIGYRWPNSGAFTTITASSTIQAAGLVGGDVGFRRTGSAGAAGYMLSQLDGSSNAHGVYWSGSNVQLVHAGSIIADFSSGGFSVTGLVSGTNGFRRSAAASSAGYMISQLDGSGNANGLYWNGSSNQVLFVIGAGTVGRFDSAGLNALPIGATTASTGRFSTLEVTAGGSTTISTGIGSVKMSSANAATNAAWIPMKYAGTTFYIPGWATNSP